MEGSGNICGSWPCYNSNFPTSIADIYNATLKKWIFERKAILTLYATSTTTLSPLSNFENDKRYYEITSFNIINTGKELGDNAKLKIEARGKILGTTPEALNRLLELNKEDPSNAIMNIGKLESDEELKGEIHSLANMSNDRNKASIGFDSDGSYKLTSKAN